MDYVQRLEGHPDDKRRGWIVDYLSCHGYQFKRHRFVSGENIYVPSDKSLEVAVSSHFDAVPESPGANDNASSVAVALDVMRRLREQPLQNIGVRYFFFDKEERELEGSSAYVAAHGFKGIRGVYNMEMVGSGSIAAVWSVHPAQEGLLLQTFERVAQEQSVRTIRFPSIIVNTSDHMSFKEKGLQDAFSITMISEADLAVAAQYYAYLEKHPKEGCSEAEWRAHLLTLTSLLESAPVFSTYHKPTDSSEHLDEKSMQTVSNLLVESLRIIDSQQGQDNQTDRP
jgi:Zn-dependent M28 family amino/carboxypeptidase